MPNYFYSGQDWEAESELFEAEYDQIMPNLERVMKRVPIFSEVGFMRVINGASPHTPDGNSMLGPAPGPRHAIPGRSRGGSDELALEDLAGRVAR